MARSFIHEPNTAPMAFQIWSIGFSGKSLPVYFRMASLERAITVLRASASSSLSSLTPLAFFTSDRMCSNGSSGWPLRPITTSPYISSRRR